MPRPCATRILRHQHSGRRNSLRHRKLPAGPKTYKVPAPTKAGRSKRERREPEWPSEQRHLRSWARLGESSNRESRPESAVQTFRSSDPCPMRKTHPCQSSARPFIFCMKNAAKLLRDLAGQEAFSKFPNAPRFSFVLAFPLVRTGRIDRTNRSTYSISESSRCARHVPQNLEHLPAQRLRLLTPQPVKKPLTKDRNAPAHLICADTTSISALRHQPFLPLRMNPSVDLQAVIEAVNHRHRLTPGVRIGRQEGPSKLKVRRERLQQYNLFIWTFHRIPHHSLNQFSQSEAMLGLA